MINLVIPMAGHGSRFSQAGYTDPKPFITFLGRRMIEHVVDAFPLHCQKIFIVLREHEERFGATAFLTERWPGSKVVITDGVTEGAACTVLLARGLIDSVEPLAIMNSDNIIHWNPTNLDLSDTHGAIMTFEDTDPRWSFARTDEQGLVVEVAEKRPISTHATAGLYFWKEGSMFCQAADQMIAKNIRVNNEFYVAPVYNENIALGHKIRCVEVDTMHGVGTPEELEKYIARQL